MSVAQNMIDHFRLQNNNNVPLTASEYDLKLNQNRTGLVLIRKPITIDDLVKRVKMELGDS
ncbi:MAG TPA: hypothetical protein VE223_07730 [Nitrososphaeraceae archaeon]|nr:hypothetical protein [Nitrososphaeraceae archaeon]